MEFTVIVIVLAIHVLYITMIMPTIQIYFYTAYGVIHSLVSTSSGTEHTYVCESELHTFRCTVNGSRLVWSINTSESFRMEFFGTSDGIGHSITRPQAIGVLLRNDRPINQLESALFVNYSTELFDHTARFSVTCASDTESDSLHTSFSGEL